MNTLIRLSNTIALGISTAVFSSIEFSSQNEGQPMLKYTRAFQASVAMAAAGILFVPFLRLGTQGNVKHDDTSQLVQSEVSSRVGQEAKEK